MWVARRSVTAAAAATAAGVAAIQLGASRRFFSIGQRPVNMLIMGPPGGGKGTISKRLKKDFDFVHLSSGDMLRAQVEKKTELGLEALKFMSNGDLVPDQVLVDLIITELKNHQGRILLDGFPRTLPQTVALEDSFDIDLVLNLDVPKSEIVGRITDRWIHAPSGRVYSYIFNPPENHGVDDVTGEPLTQRDDDKEDKVIHRLEAYDNMTAPLLTHFEAKGLLSSFDGNNYPDLVQQNRRSDAIYTDLREVVEKKLKSIEG